MAESDQELVASAALPAAEATATSGSVIIEDKQCIALYCKYTRGGAAGKVTIRVEYSYDGDEDNCYQDGVQGAPSVALGSDEDTPVQRRMFSYQATGAALETFIIRLTSESPHTNINAKSLRIVYNETGNGANPGTFQCTLRKKD